MSVWEELVMPLDDLPPVEFAFAYGSGVFQQPGHLDLSKKEVPMVDYILGVENPALWHTQNIERNPQHYNSWLAYFGGQAVSYVAENIGAGVHFNAFVPWRGKMIKYGVISMANLVQDILCWNSMYVSGRLQKPVYILVDNWDLAKVNQVNLQAAVLAALLILPAEFSEEKLYTTITGLSYMGDVRMLFAEDKNKVYRIVQGSAEQFHSLYRIPLYHAAAAGLLELPTSFGSLRSVLQKNCSPRTVETLVNSLPTAVLRKVVPQTSLMWNSEKAISMKGNPSQAVQSAIRRIVRVSSMKQTLSGLLAAGGVNAMRYVWNKASKAWHSRY